MARPAQPLPSDGLAAATPPARGARGRAALRLAPRDGRCDDGASLILGIGEVAALAERLRANIQKGVHLAPAVLDVVLATLLADGHLLV